MDRRNRRNEEGIALLFVVMATLVILGAVGVVTERVYSSKRFTDDALVRTQADEICKAGIDMAAEGLWNQYVISYGNTTGNLASYRYWLDNSAAIATQNYEDTNGNGILDNGEDFNGNGVLDTPADAIVVSEGAPRALPGSGRIVGLTIRRTDDITGINFTIISTGEVDTAATGATGDSARVRRTATQTIRIAGELFNGFEFAVMANNINCILCHAKFHNLDMTRNTDPTKYGSYDRVKVACLESMMMRTTENIGTFLAGTLYSRGVVQNQAGTNMTSAQIASSTFKGHQFSNTNGKIAQSGTGATTQVNMMSASKDANGLFQQFGNLYMNYPTDTEAMTDGTLPKSFPAPFPDDNKNRQVDNVEFQQVVNSADGSLKFELDPAQIGGSIKGGVAYGVPSGSAYTGTSLPTTSNSALSELETSGSYSGNLMLVGTTDDPIIINKKVAIDGDLVIKGPVKGWGQLLVRGNVYVIGDVTYADAPGEFGKAADGTKNGLALTAGGSVMIGDYLTIRGKNNSKDTDKFPDKAGSIDMRTQNKTKSLTSGSKTETVAIGYFDTGVVDPGVVQANNQSQYSFTTSETMLFNRMEKAKATADPTYTPRYYRIRPSQPIYTYTASDEHAVKYNDAGVATITNLTGAVIHDLSPKNFWVSESQLRQFWYADEMTRPDSGRPFKFDGLLYSNNSIFAITRSDSRHNSNAKGKMEVRGSIVSADLGVLTPGEEPDGAPRKAFDLYYDKRVADFLRVEDTSQVQFRRIAFNFD